jgi:hypothetical protein
MDQRILESKKKRRKELAALSFTEKIKILEKLRDRDCVLAAAGLRGKHEPGANDKAAKDNE